MSDNESRALGLIRARASELDAPVIVDVSAQTGRFLRAARDFGIGEVVFEESSFLHSKSECLLELLDEASVRKIDRFIAENEEADVYAPAPEEQRLLINYLLLSLAGKSVQDMLTILDGEVRNGGTARTLSKRAEWMAARVHAAFEQDKLPKVNTAGVPSQTQLTQWFDRVLRVCECNAHSPSEEIADWFSSDLYAPMPHTPDSSLPPPPPPADTDEPTLPETDTVFDDSTALFVLGSMMEHDCVPACTAVLIPESKHIKKSCGVRHRVVTGIKLQLRTLRSVREGDKLSISYVDAAQYLHRNARRHLVKSARGFECQCSVCHLDPESDTVEHTRVFAHPNDPTLLLFPVLATLSHQTVNRDDDEDFARIGDDTRFLAFRVDVDNGGNTDSTVPTRVHVPRLVSVPLTGSLKIKRKQRKQLAKAEERIASLFRRQQENALQVALQRMLPTTSEDDPRDPLFQRTNAADSSTLVHNAHHLWSTMLKANVHENAEWLVATVGATAPLQASRLLQRRTCLVTPFPHLLCSSNYETRLGAVCGDELQCHVYNTACVALQMGLCDDSVSVAIEQARGVTSLMFPERHPFCMEVAGLESQLDNELHGRQCQMERLQQMFASQRQQPQELALDGFDEQDELTDEELSEMVRAMQDDD